MPVLLNNKLSILLSFIIGISSTGFSQTRPYQDPRLGPYIRFFEQACGKSADKVTVIFTHKKWPDKRQVGVYEVYNGRVKLLASWWNRSTVVMRYVLVLHELGHAVLDKDHLPDKKAIMHSTLPEMETLDPARLKELCAPL